MDKMLPILHVINLRVSHSWPLLRMHPCRSRWDVSNVETFSWTFGKAYKFNKSLSAWNVRKGANFDLMFAYGTG